MRNESVRESLMPEVVATSIAGYFSILTFLAIFKSGIDHAGFILILDAVCFTFWFALLTRKNIRRRRALERAREGNILSYFLIFVLVLYLGDVCWNKGYLNLFAVDTLFSGNSHIDTMYDATIAEAIKNYHIPSILLNRIHYLHYNYGSHALIALIALVLNLPALTVYNYLFPVVFCPIFFYILLCLALQLKRMNKADPSLSSFDLVILLVGLVGIFPPSFLAKMGIFSSALFDESFLIGMIALFSFLLFAVYSFNSGFLQRKTYRKCFLAVFIPVFILICAACKISIGFLFFVGCTYYVFRSSHWKRARYLLALLYAFVFIASYCFFSSADNSSFHRLDYLKHYVEKGFWIWYFIASYLFTFIFVFSGILKKGDLATAIKRNELIDEETLVAVSIAGALPGLVMRIPDGGASYYSIVQGILVLPFLIGCGRLKIRQGLPAQIAYWIVALSMLLNTNSYSFIKKVVSQRVSRSELSRGQALKKVFVDRLKEGRIGDAFTMAANWYFSPMQTNESIAFRSQLDQVNELTRTSKRETAVFLAPESQLWNVQKDSRASPFFVPCYTGLVLINAVHSDGRTLYDGGGGTIADTTSLNYGFYALRTASEMDLSQSVEAAKKHGFKRLVVVDKDVHVIDLSNGF